MTEIYLLRAQARHRKFHGCRASVVGGVGVGHAVVASFNQPAPKGVEHQIEPANVTAVEHIEGWAFLGVIVLNWGPAGGATPRHCAAIIEC